MKNATQALKVFLVGTEFFKTGGIQRVNRNLADALSSHLGDCPVSLEVFSYADAPVACKSGPAYGMSASAGNRMSLAASLARRLIAAKPHIILFTHVALLKLMPLCRLLVPSAPVAVLCHGVEVWEKAAPSVTRHLSKVDWILAPSQFTLNKLLKLHGPTQARTQVIPHGLDRNWQIVTRAAGSSTAPRLLTVCRMSKDDSRFGTKGVDLLLEAMVKLRKTIPDIHLTIAGDGDDRPRMEDKSADLKLRSCVEFAGSLDEQALKAHYAQATVFVLPSDMEGFGMVFIEAMAYGLPIVALNAAATPEVVQDGVTGILIKESHAESLAAAIATLLGNRELRQSMSEASRRAVTARFGYEQFALQWSCWLKLAAAEQAYLVRHMPAFSQFWNVSGR